MYYCSRFLVWFLGFFAVTMQSTMCFQYFGCFNIKIDVGGLAVWIEKNFIVSGHKKKNTIFNGVENFQFTWKWLSWVETWYIFKRYKFFEKILRNFCENLCLFLGWYPLDLCIGNKILTLVMWSLFLSFSKKALINIFE